MSEYVMVPKVVSTEMIEAGYAVVYDTEANQRCLCVAEIYEAMLAAAPKPTVLKAEEVYWQGLYLWRPPWHLTYEPVVITKDARRHVLQMIALDHSEKRPLIGQYIGPIPEPAV